MIAQAERLVSEVTEAERFERSAQVAADHCDGAEILIDHGDEGAVARDLRLGARRRVNRRSLIQVAAYLVYDAHNIESLRNGARRADDIRGSNCSFENVEGGAPVSLLEVRAAEPAQRRKTGVGVGVGISDESLIYRAGIGPASVALGVLGAIDALPDGGGFNRHQFDCWPAVGHDGARGRRAARRGLAT